MPVLTAGFRTIGVTGGDGSWTDRDGWDYDGPIADWYGYVTFTTPSQIGYLKLASWTYASTIPDGSTINSVLFTIQDTYHSDYGNAGQWGIIFEDTDSSTYRKWADPTDLMSAEDRTIPTTGTGQTVSWWRSGWTSQDFIDHFRDTSNYIRFYAKTYTVDKARLFGRMLVMSVDYTEPSSGGSIHLGSFG